jgi:succinyl-CoA synthetase alpha subunit
MSILVGRETRVLVQGMGKHGTFHAVGCRDFGTTVVGGVTPGKGGATVEGFPLFDTVEQAVRATGANTSLVFVPPAGAADAIMEAADARLALVVCITEGIPTLDVVRVNAFLASRTTRLIGPNCPGIISPGARSKVGIMPAHIHLPGPVGVVSRSGTLTYEAVAQLTQRGLGQTTCVGIGGDPIVGTTHRDALALFQEDPETQAIVLIGEIGGTAEEEAAAFVRERVTKPVIGFVAGQTAPPGRRMGHAGAIIAGGKGTAREKMDAMRAAGISVVASPAEIGAEVARRLGQELGPGRSRPAKGQELMERTLSIIKPDAVAAGKAGEILARLECAGFTLVALRLRRLSRDEAEGLYRVHRGTPFFEGLCRFMSSGPCITLVLEREQAIAKLREMMGTTDPAKAAPGTIRRDFGSSTKANAIHGSDAPETARFEIGYFFPGIELIAPPASD